MERVADELQHRDRRRDPARTVRHHEYFGLKGPKGFAAWLRAVGGALLLASLVWLDPSPVLAEEPPAPPEKPDDPRSTGQGDGKTPLEPSREILFASGDPPEEPDSAGATGTRGWSFQNLAHYYRSTRRRQIDFYEGSIGFYHRFDNPLALGLDIVGMDVREESEQTGGIGAMPFVRVSLLQPAGWSIFFEATIGAIYSDEPLPSRGTRFNFTEAGGFGARIRLGFGGHIIIGARYYHLSNGNIVAGRERNPGTDGVGVYAGYEVLL